MLLGVDVGGTFTDAVLIDDAGAVFTAKVPSSPADQSRAVLEAARLALAASGAPASRIRRFAHGMTVATNALLEGETARTVLVATAGFTDVIELGRQARPDLYRLEVRPREPLVPAQLRFPAAERIGPEGVLEPLTAAEAGRVAEAVAAAQPEAVAVALLHSYADPSHELALRDALLYALPDGVPISLSSETVGTFREFERTATTALDACLTPRLARYLHPLAEHCAAAQLPEPSIMQSAGGLTDLARAADHAALTLLSGPAGGVAGARALAELSGEPDVVCFDMGGTSCDVCVIEDGVVGESAERVIAQRPLALPSLDIETIGAGGGSIAWRDAGGALRVGPRSAGAQPGPACYGHGGELPTVTDANLLLGRLPADTPLAGGVKLGRTAAERAIAGLAAELGLTALACAEGIVRVAEAEMLGAIRLMTVERGVDPRSFALLGFGGAGGLHATALAEQLSIGRVIFPRLGGVLSAFGLAGAAPRRDASRSVLLAGERFTGARLDDVRRSLVRRAADELGSPVVRMQLRHELRYGGQSFELAVDERTGPEGPTSGPEELRERFAAAHMARYGYRDDGAEIELVTVRAAVWGQAPHCVPHARSAAPTASSAANIVLDGETLRCSVLTGERRAGEAISGPALLALDDATLLVRPGWSGTVDEQGTVRLEHGGG
jgi:N-methylhydantoinase A